MTADAMNAKKISWVDNKSSIAGNGINEVTTKYQIIGIKVE